MSGIRRSSAAGRRARKVLGFAAGFVGGGVLLGSLIAIAADPVPKPRPDAEYAWMLRPRDGAPPPLADTAGTVRYTGWHDSRPDLDYETVVGNDWDWPQVAAYEAPTTVIYRYGEAAAYPGEDYAASYDTAAPIPDAVADTDRGAPAAERAAQAAERAVIDAIRAQPEPPGSSEMPERPSGLPAVW